MTADHLLELPEQLAAALVAASGDLTDVARSRVGDAGSYTYRYAELADVLVTVRAVLLAHDLAHFQPVETEPAHGSVAVTVRTMIVHTSGAAFVSPSLRLVVASPDPQRVGSAITYGRRYSLMATLGIAGDDDDGAAAGPTSSTSTTRGPQPAGRPSTGRSPQEAQARELLNAASPQVRTGVQKAFREHFGVSLSNLSTDRHAEALSFVMEQLTVPDEVDAP